MAKNIANAGLDRVSRLLDLVPYLSSHQGISLADLATKFDIPVNQMMEDLNTLWMCGLPGYTPLELMDFSFESGYVTVRNADTLEKPRSLLRDEVLALLLGLDYLADQIPAENSQLTETIKDLIESLSTGAQKKSPVESIALQGSSILTRGELVKAISYRSALSINYFSATRDESTSRNIAPLQLHVDRGIEYLLAYCFTAAAYRTFRVDRISRTAPCEIENAPVPPSQFQEGRNITFTVEIHSALREVAERFSLAKASQGEIQSAECFNQEWLLREMMSLGSAATLITPIEARQALLERSQKALALYLFA